MLSAFASLELQSTNANDELGFMQPIRLRDVIAQLAQTLNSFGMLPA